MRCVHVQQGRLESTSPPGGLSWKEAPSSGKQSFGPSPGSANDQGRGEVWSRRPGVSFPSLTRITQEGGITRGSPRTGCGIPHCHCPRSGCGIPVPHCLCPGNFHAGKVARRRLGRETKRTAQGTGMKVLLASPCPCVKAARGTPRPCVKAARGTPRPCVKVVRDVPPRQHDGFAGHPPAPA